MNWNTLFQGDCSIHFKDISQDTLTLFQINWNWKCVLWFKAFFSILTQWCVGCFRMFVFLDNHFLNVHNSRQLRPSLLVFWHSDKKKHSFWCLLGFSPELNIRSSSSKWNYHLRTFCCEKPFLTCLLAVKTWILKRQWKEVCHKLLSVSLF